MHKDQLIQVHALLCQLKHELQAKGTGLSFSEYESLGVSPLHVHRSKSEHTRAIFILGKELAAAISSGDFSGPDLVSHRFSAMASRMSKATVPLARMH